MLLILASLIIPIIWLTYELKKHDKLEKNALNDFWRREEEANLVRKKPLDNLNYVEIPFDFIPESLLADNEEVKDCLELLNKLSEKKIVNFTGFSNTDLKMEYGAANLTELSQYDENYTLYARTIYKLANLYYRNGYESNARVLLEKAVESGTDISGNYLLLARIYQEHKETDKLNSLLWSAENLRSAASKKNLIRSLEECARKC